MSPDIMHGQAIGHDILLNTVEAPTVQQSPGFPVASSIEPDTRRILCIGCEQPILAEELGGVGAAAGGGEAWFHNHLPCMLAAAEHMTTNHANELKGIVKGKHPKPEKEYHGKRSKQIPF